VEGKQEKKKTEVNMRVIYHILELIGCGQLIQVQSALQSQKSPSAPAPATTPVPSVAV